MTRTIGACLVCGEPLVYFEEARELECALCHQKFMAYASCAAGHYVCDECHARKGIEAIMAGCRESGSRDPIAILQTLMNDPFIYMHGPEHHVLVGAALLTAYANSGGQVELAAALEEMKARGSSYPGGACGLWGCCGAAVSAGIFMSIVTKATPLTVTPWRLSNQMTAEALAAIAPLGGPRCCKRNSFTAVKEAVRFTKEHLGVAMELPDQIQCDFSAENQQCIKARCPYHRK